MNSRPATDIPMSVRKVVLARDRHRCRWCGRTNAGLHLHHITYRSAGGQHVPENLITLCASHHELVHTDKGTYPPMLTELLDKPAITGLQLVRWAARSSDVRQELEESR